jgi:hypothetical protein
MNTIRVSKNQLIETLRVNRDEHRAIFEKAQEVYRTKVIKELDRALADAKAGRKIVTSFYLPVPEDHTDDFDTAIQMMEWAQGEVVEIEQGDFQCYVENKWRWRQSFAGSTESYLVQ